MTSITKPSLTEVSQTCDRKSGLTRHISFLKCIQRFLASKGNGNIFLRIVSRIIRQYNLHSWEFVINAQLNSSKSLRLWNLWPIILLYCIPLQTTVRFALCHLPENGCFMSQMSQWVMSHESWVNESMSRIWKNNIFGRNSKIKHYLYYFVYLLHCCLHVQGLFLTWNVNQWADC